MKLALPLLILALLLAACIPPQTPAAATPTPTLYLPPDIYLTPQPTQPACTSFKTNPTPSAGTDSMFPPPTSADWSLGPQDAPVTIIIYNNFQCPACNDAVLLSLQEAFPEQVRLVYRHFVHFGGFEKGPLAAQATEAAGAQGQFWEMHDLLFAQQAEWIELSGQEFSSWVGKQAEGLGLDAGQFRSDFQAEATVQKIQEAADFGRQRGIQLLPLILINGQIYTGPTDLLAFSQIVSLIVLGERQFDECPPMAINPARQYLAILQTEKGEVVLELFADKAPLAVNAFVFLARNGWYDNITFHRVQSGFLALTGDPSGTGQGNPGFYFKNELDPALQFDRPGMVAMLNSGPDTNGSQFFITFAAAPQLSGSYTIFGRVLSGMDVLEQLTPREPKPGVVLPPGDALISVTIEER